MVNNEFWLRRWADNQIGFHKPGVHPLLERFWPRVAAGAGRVLVPLCGKSDDVMWLAGRGHDVVGIDLSEIAARSFADEHGLEFSVREDPPFTRLRSGRIEFLVGDFFDLTPEKTGRFSLVYDRASLIALPPDARQRYASHLRSLLEDSFHILLITLMYDQKRMEGPPFAVGEDEIRALWSGYTVDSLDERDCLEEEPRFRERGLEWMKEAVGTVTSL